MEHLNYQQLEAGLPHVVDSPKESGTLQLIVIRPEENKREVLAEGHMTTKEGLIGDDWIRRKSSRTPDGSPHPDKQLNVMNARAAQLVAQSKDRWALAGDQLYVDFDLSEANLPPGSRLSIGEAIIEITPLPHNGCKKFVQRFGLDAMKFVNSEIGRQHHLRGVNAKVVKDGVVRQGDPVRKVL